MSNATIAEPKTNAAIALHDAAAPPPAFRYNVVITWNSATTSYVVSPGTMLMPNGFGTGKNNWPSPAYIKWYIIPNDGDTVIFNNSGSTSGINFTTAGAPLVSYDSANETASAQWTNSASTQQSFDYTVNLLVNGKPVSIDPDVENQAPPG